jgi:hypothetical protein
MASGRSPARAPARIAGHLLHADRLPIVRPRVMVFRAPPTAAILRAPIRHRASGEPGAVSHGANIPTSLTHAGTAADRPLTQIVSQRRRSRVAIIIRRKQLDGRVAVPEAQPFDFKCAFHVRHSQFEDRRSAVGADNRSNPGACYVRVLKWATSEETSGLSIPPASPASCRAMPAVRHGCGSLR